MSDLITPAAYSDKSTSYETTHATLDDFRKLTLNRNKNLGSLVVNSKGGLKCADHHVFRPLNGFGSVKPEDARRVREAFVNAVTKELASRFDLLIKSEEMRNPENVEALKKKIGELNELISDMFLNKGNDNPRSSAFAPLERKDVKSFIENIELLEKNATPERLLKMNAAKLLNLSDTVNRQEAEKYESLTGGQLRQIIADGPQQPAKTQADPTKSCEAATEAIKTASRDDLKKAGQDFIRAVFPGISNATNSEVFKAVNGILSAKDNNFIYLDDKGDLTFANHASEEEIRTHFERLIGAVAFMEDGETLGKEIGGLPTKESIITTLKNFTDQLNTAKGVRETAVKDAQENAQKEELSEKLGEALGKASDREALRKAANAALHKCDLSLVNLAKQMEGLDTNNLSPQDRLKLSQCKRLLDSAFQRAEIKSFLLDNECKLVLAKDADINAIKKDVGRLLAALVGHNIVINGSDSVTQDDLKALRGYFGCDQNDKTAVAPAMHAFIDELANSKGSDYHPIPNNEIEVDGDGRVEEPPVEEKKDEGNKVEGENADKPKVEVKFKTDLDTVNKMKEEGRTKVKEPLIPPEGDESHTSVEKNTTSSDKTEGPQGKSVLEQIEEELEKKSVATKKPQTNKAPVNALANNVPMETAPKKDPIVSQVKPLTDMIDVGQQQKVDAVAQGELERTYSGVDYSAEIDGILSDKNVKSDTPVYFTDESRSKLCSGKTGQSRKMTPRQIGAESGAMRAGLLKYAYDTLGIKSYKEDDAGVSENDRYVIKKIKTALLGGKGEDGAKVASSPVTKGDLEYVKWMLGGARIDGNPEVNRVAGKGVPKVSQLTVEQQRFLDNEAKEFKAWYDAKKAEWAKSDIDLDKNTNVRKSEVLSWKLQKAFNKDYQEEVCRLFGKLLEPRQSKGMPEAKNPSVQTEVKTLGGDGLSARHHANKEYPDDVFCYQIAADATYCGGTLLESGQEEALFMDMPAMNLAYLLHEGYIEPYDKIHDTPLQIDQYDGQRLWLKYSLDENGRRKLDTWMGACLPTYSSTTDGIPNENGETKMSWFSFCAATALGGAGGATANIDRGGFLRALENRPVKPLNMNDPEQVRNANAFFDEIENTCKAFKKRTAPKDVQFLNDKEKFGYGASYDNRVWNEMMFVAHFYTSGEFDVLAPNAKEQFKKLIDLMRSGEYKGAMDEAYAAYVEVTEHQHVSWVANQNETGAKRVARTNPGGTLFANSRTVTLKAAGKAIQGWGGEMIHFHYGFSGTSETMVVNEGFQAAKKAKR